MRRPALTRTRVLRGDRRRPAPWATGGAAVPATHSCVLPGLHRGPAGGRTADLVTISSTGAHITFPHYAVYGAAKAALTCLSASL